MSMLFWSYRIYGQQEFNITWFQVFSFMICLGSLNLRPSNSLECSYVVSDVVPVALGAK